jgi:hypothetical protein
VADIDTALISLTHDSLGRIPFTIIKVSMNIRALILTSAWSEDSKYLLTFLPGAVTDFWGRANDTLRHTIVVNARDQFGDLTLRITGLDSTKEYLVLLKSGEQILDRFVIEQLSEAQLNRPGMVPGKYVAEIIEDDNSNQAWDTGDYHTRRQPERKMIFILENLRAGWELEAALIWK